VYTAARAWEPRRHREPAGPMGREPGVYMTAQEQVNTYLENGGQAIKAEIDGGGNRARRVDNIGEGYNQGSGSADR